MSFNVISQITRFSKAFFTISTFVRSLFRMLSYMNFEYILSWKTLSTIWKDASKWFFFSVETSNMIFKMSNCCEAHFFLFTFFTFMRFNSFMAIIMVFETCLIKVKLITTIFSAIQFCSYIQVDLFFMFFQTILSRINFTTVLIRTHKSLI